MGESRIVTAVGVSVNSEQLGEASAKRIEAAVAAEIQRCLDDGLTTEEKDASAMRERMKLAHDREFAAIQAGQ
jgi:hypothetical protein